MFKSVVSLLLVAGAAAFAPATPFVAMSNTALFMSSELEAKVKDIIVEQLGVDADKVVPEASLIDDLGADSLDTVELIMAIEEEFDNIRAAFRWAVRVHETDLAPRIAGALPFHPTDRLNPEPAEWAKCILLTTRFSTTSALR